MLGHRRSSVPLFLRLLLVAAPLAGASVASAQAPAGGAPAPPPPPPSTAPAPPEPRPPLTQGPAAAPVAPPTISPVRSINPAHDQQDLAAQGAQRPGAGETAGQEVFSEDWWAHARPVIELHGYFRTRAELFHNFSLGRHTSSVLPAGDQQYLWPIPLDQSFSTPNGAPGQTAAVCGSNGKSPCNDKTES